MPGQTETMAGKFRKLMNDPGLIRAVNVYDPFTARIAQSVGFKALGVGGFQVGAHLCVTEPMLTLTETINVARQITQAISIPIKVDCGAGFGEPAHVTRTVREAESAGIASIHIEDQIYPKRAHYHRGLEHVIPAEEMVEKIKAAVAARKNPDFVIVGRTDAILTDGIKEGIRRANLYAEAGCDLIEMFPQTKEHAVIAPKEIKAPCLYVNSCGRRDGRPVFTWQELEQLGYKMALDSTAVMMSAAKAIKLALESYIRDGRQPPELTTDVETRSWVESISGLDELYEIEERTTERKRA